MQKKVEDSLQKDLKKKSLNKIKAIEVIDQSWFFE